MDKDGYRRAHLKELKCSLDPCLEEELEVLLGAPLTFENDEHLVRLNEILEQKARIQGIMWPKYVNSPFNEDDFRRKVLSSLSQVESPIVVKIDKENPISILCEDPSNPASAFAVIKNRPLEGDIYEIAHILGLDSVVPHLKFKDPNITVECFQRPINSGLIPHLSMRHLLFLDFFSEPLGSLTLRRVYLVNKENPRLAEKYPRIF